MKPDGTGIIYLCKDRIYLYSNKLSKIIEGKFSGRAVKDLKIPDEDHFVEEVSEFLKKKHILESKFVLVVADNAAYVKEFTSAVVNQHEIDTFLQSSPFSDKVSKTIHEEHGLVVFVANRHLLIMLKNAIEWQGHTVEAILPACAFSKDFGKQHKLTFEMASEIFAKALSLQQYFLLPPPLPKGMIHETYTMTPEDRLQRRHDILRLYAYTTIFGLLVITLVVVWNYQNPGPSQIYRGKASQPTPTITIASPSATLTPLPSVKERQNSSVKILNYSGYNDLAKKLQAQLLKDHFQYVNIENRPVSPSTKTTIIYSNKLSQEVRDVVFTDVAKYEQGVAVQVSVPAQSSVTIILGK